MVEVLLRVHQPFGIAEERDHNAGSIGRKPVDLGKSHRQLGRSTRIQHYDVGLGATESLGKGILGRSKIGNTVFDIPRVQPIA